MMFWQFVFLAESVKSAETLKKPDLKIEYPISKDDPKSVLKSQELPKQSSWKIVKDNWYWRSSIKLGIGAKLANITVLFNGKEKIYASDPWLSLHPNYNTEFNYSTKTSAVYQVQALFELTQLWSEYFSPFLSLGPYFNYSSISASNTYNFIAQNITGAGFINFKENNGLGSFTEIHDMTVKVYDVGISINYGFIILPLKLYPVTLIQFSHDNKVGACFLKRKLIFTEISKEEIIKFTPEDFLSSADLCLSTGYSMSTELFGLMEIGLSYEYNFETTHENPSGYLLLKLHSFLANLKVNL